MHEPRPVKLIVAMLFAREELLPAVRHELVQAFGEIDYCSPRFPFDLTAYYHAEMGSPLYRLFLSFAHLVSPQTLAGAKQRSHALEQRFAEAGRRRVNLDPGYLDTDKFVLASWKYHGYKIYLSDGVWADLTLHYEKGRFTALPWSFPDFRSGRYEPVFLRIREIYKQQLRALAAHRPSAPIT
ncbi:MAG: DUF4416 family protein [candidate division KSB1 bacterium]|nr:DUF4416 family protein [candidate division KSB1 bacterium]MDZ7274738.1 DUF4416 family protein [candidate division KSB1 bacterium]MDZ7285563.1 DUF4416 family protein [candidate division KSB1 bacterium]MDZ7298595.1 DUF4416 family protein [candidate division KSB1 bacterium]MDZ7306774.1 DUF4416 family protein [candidate division KSB1 bacterium]